MSLQICLRAKILEAFWYVEHYWKVSLEESEHFEFLRGAFRQEGDGKIQTHPGKADLIWHLEHYWKYIYVTFYNSKLEIEKN